MSKLILTNDTWPRITEYVRQIDAEIGMFGYVTLIDGDFYVDEVFLVEQEVTGSSVDFADQGLEYAITKAIDDNRIDDLKFCCHSHVNMGAFWSTTDEDMIEGMNNGMTPYLVSLVVNKKHETKQRVDFFNPLGDLGDFTSQVRYDLDLAVDNPHNVAIAEEIASLVKRPTYRYSKSKSTKYPTFGLDKTDEQLPILNAAGDITGWEDLGLEDMSDDELKMLGIDPSDYVLIDPYTTP